MKNNKFIKVLPNILSSFRLILAVFFPFCFIFISGFAAFIIFIVAVLTDSIDGFIARRFNAITLTGKWLDPVADKLLKLNACFAFAFCGIISWWVFGVFAFVEFGIIIGGVAAYTIKKYLTGSNLLGKIAANIAYLSLVLCFFKETESYANYGFYLTLLLTFASGVLYLSKFLIFGYKNKKIQK